MTGILQDENVSSAAADAQEALRSLVAAGRQRISAALLAQGEWVWIKRHDISGKVLARRLHALVSPLLPRPFLRASPGAAAEALAERELRKMRAFRAAGFAVPPLVYREDAVLVLGHVDGVVEPALARMRERDARAHDALLVGMAAALGRAHSAGLCHGRPHPRDMFVSGQTWGFFDFEEEPEASMPLPAAQARDVWLLFLQISERALLPGTEEAALDAYARSGPAQSLERLKPIVAFFSPMLAPLSMLEKLSLGSDGRRLVKATRFLKEALASRDEDSAA